MPILPTVTDPVEAFISRWENSCAAERANYQMFLSELCDILGVPRHPSSAPKYPLPHQQPAIINPSSNWPDRLPEQVTLIRHLLTQTPAATPSELSAHLGRKNQKRTDQIEGIIGTLKGLGQV
jgi:hypothetical protein